MNEFQGIFTVTGKQYQHSRLNHETQYFDDCQRLLKTGNTCNYSVYNYLKCHFLNLPHLMAPLFLHLKSSLGTSCALFQCDSATPESSV